MSAHIPDGYLPCKHCAGLGVVQKSTKTAAHFPAFWAAWPRSERKQDKAACLTKWKDRNYDAIAPAIMADIAVKLRTQRWQLGFIEAPLVYLNNRRWEDGVQPDEKPVDNSTWMKTDEGIAAQGKRMNMQARPGEDFRQYAARIAKAMAS